MSPVWYAFACMLTSPATAFRDKRVVQQIKIVKIIRLFSMIILIFQNKFYATKFYFGCRKGNVLKMFVLQAACFVLHHC